MQKPFSRKLKKLGYLWVFKLGKEQERQVAYLQLVTPKNKSAATVFLTYDVDGFNWYTHDLHPHGYDYENSKGATVIEAMREAEESFIRNSQA